MTTLDDAAERDSAIAEAYDKWRGDELYFPSHHAIFGAGWIAATEAAAKKCEARDDAERYQWLMSVWDESCPYANGQPLWDYDSSMVSAAIDHERAKGG